MNFSAVLVLPKTATSAQIHENMSFIWIVWSTLYVYLWKRGRKKGKSSKVECKKCHFNSVLSVSFAKYRQFWNISPFSHILWSQFVYYGKTSNGKRSHLQMVILAISNFAMICKWNSYAKFWTFPWFFCVCIWVVNV